MCSQSKGIGSADFRVNGLKYGCLDQSNHRSVGMSSDSCDITAEVSRTDPGRQICGISFTASALKSGNSKRQHAIGERREAMSRPTRFGTLDK